jgi:trehalose 6-phosphate phosphatase
MKFSTEAELDRWVDQAQRKWLFLDYDGTLTGFATTPDEIEPEEEVIQLVKALSDNPGLRVVIISGRRLSDIQKLLPVPGIFLAGVYGIEIQNPAGERIQRVVYQNVRPFLARLKPGLEELIAGRKGFFLEDKGLALALHARFAEAAEAEQVLAAARQIIRQAEPPEHFRMLGGHKFLEVAPTPAHKGGTVSYLLRYFAWPEASLIFIGDDDKDEQAFGVVHSYGGAAILVSGSASSPPPTVADYSFESPQALRHWLKEHFSQN